MTDLPPTTEAPVDGAPPPSDAPPPTDAAPPSEPATPEPLPDGETFDRAYVEKLRDEAARYRVTAREREEALARYDFLNDVPSEGQDLLLDMVQRLVADPKGQGAIHTLQVLKNLTGDDFDQVLEASKSPQYLTREEAAKIAEAEADKREQARIRSEAERQLKAEVEGLGYQDQTPDTGLLFWYANTATEGDLNKAHEEVQKFRQGIIDAYVEEQRNKNSKFPPVSGAVSEGPTPPGDEGPHSVEEATQGLRKWLASQKTAS